MKPGNDLGRAGLLQFGAVCELLLVLITMHRKPIRWYNPRSRECCSDA
jgi:hypothetical protein